jgi:UDP-N-acetylmuramate dehydrogenase
MGRESNPDACRPAARGGQGALMSHFSDMSGFVTPAVPLAPLTWFRLGGPAEYLARPRSHDELLACLRRAREAGLDFHLIAGGSNILVGDEGVRGLVVLLESPLHADVTIDGPIVRAGAAVPLTVLVSQVARAGLAGLEPLTGIPGTLGGAVRGNSGGRQGTIAPVVRAATVIDDDLTIQQRTSDELVFGYRTSNLDEPVILSVELELQPDDPEAVVKRMRRVWIVKKENQPYGHQSSGCIFRNPSPETSAGLLIERAGLKGLQVGGAEVSDRHANYIIAHPGASSADVVTLIDRIRSVVLEHSGQALELQIQVW